jgi:pimeloyl-ACP methyl ester carboxylesterase
MATIVLCHGAWSAAWAWRKMRPLFVAAGHAFYAPTYTGLGERAHLAGPHIDLETHIADVIGLIETEELSGITLLGHSYGGAVATGVADRVRDRVIGLIYLDAFVPRNGQSLLDLVPDSHGDRQRQDASDDPEGWRVRPNPPPPDTLPEDLAWVERHRRDMPIRCFSTPLRIIAEPSCPRHYIYASRTSPADPFRPFLERAKTEPGWTATEIDASHSPAVTAPQLLMRTLAPLLADQVKDSPSDTR